MLHTILSLGSQSKCRIDIISLYATKGHQQIAPAMMMIYDVLPYQERNIETIKIVNKIYYLNVTIQFLGSC